MEGPVPFFLGEGSIAKLLGGLGPPMRSLAIIALIIGGTLPVLAQNAPPTNGYPPPPAGASGTPATYGPPAPGVIPGAPGPVYSHRYRIVVPLTRRYDYQPYWWPQGQYHWSPFGLERWGYWCEGGRGRQINCGVPR